MAGLSLTWKVLPGPGSAGCTIAAGSSEATVHASYLSDAPRDLLYAITRIAAGSKHARSQFAGEPGACRWLFHGYGGFVDIEIIAVDDERKPDTEGRPIWHTSRRPIAELVQATVSCFADIRAAMDEERYRRAWGFPFPADDLVLLQDALRRRADLPGQA